MMGRRTCSASKFINYESTYKATDDTDDGSNWDRGGGLAKGDSANKDHCFQTWCASCSDKIEKMFMRTRPRAEQ